MKLIGQTGLSVMAYTRKSEKAKNAINSRRFETAVRAALQSMAEEEGRHAVLSFRIVAWALRSGDANVAASIRAAFAAPWPHVDIGELSLRSGVDIARLAAAAEQGVHEVITPAAARLLAA